MTHDFSELLIAAIAGAIAGFTGLAAYYAASIQNRLTATNVAADWMRDLRSWASEAVDVLSESEHLVDRESFRPDDEAPSEGITRCQIRLSALIDRGRFFLPNEVDNCHGTHEPIAYRGFRHATLDPLVAAYRILQGKANLHSFSTRTEAINGVKREFVSSVQEILDPRSSNKTVATIIRNSHSDRKRDDLMGGLFPGPIDVPPGEEAVLYTAAMRRSKSKN